MFFCTLSLWIGIFLDRISAVQQNLNCWQVFQSRCKILNIQHSLNCWQTFHSSFWAAWVIECSLFLKNHDATLFLKNVAVPFDTCCSLFLKNHDATLFISLQKKKIVFRTSYSLSIMLSQLYPRGWHWTINKNNESSLLSNDLNDALGSIRREPLFEALSGSRMDEILSHKLGRFDVGNREKKTTNLHHHGPS